MARLLLKTAPWVAIKCMRPPLCRFSDTEHLSFEKKKHIGPAAEYFEPPHYVNHSHRTAQAALCILSILLCYMVECMYICTYSCSFLSPIIIRISCLQLKIRILVINNPSKYLFCSIPEF